MRRTNEKLDPVFLLKKKKRKKREQSPVKFIDHEPTQNRQRSSLSALQFALYSVHRHTILQFIELPSYIISMRWLN